MTATFMVSATGHNPKSDSISYQWQKNGINLVNGGNLSGTTSNILNITGISDHDAAVYSVIVSNSTGSVTSSNAMLTVDDLPFIATQPLNQTVVVGGNATFNVSAYGAPPFIFQWYHNETPLGSLTTGNKFFVFHIDKY